MNQDIHELVELVKRYEAHRDFYLKENYNETQVRSEFLDPLFELLGWDIKNRAGKPTNEREVILEEPLKAGADENTKKPDYTFRLFAERKFFLEAKKPHVNIHEVDAPARQARRYGYTAHLKISVLSNFEYLIIYDASKKVEKNDKNDVARIKKYHYTEYEEKFEELKRLLGKESVYSGQFDEEWKDIEIQLQKSSVDTEFLRQINEWRILLGNEILNAIPSIDIEELGDMVQSYINKILFLRVCEDRNIETYQALLQIANEEQFSELVNKFKDADRKYNSGLFKQELSNEVVCNMGSSFWKIIKQLYFPESPYSFAVLSSDVLGRIYEIFLTQRLAMVDDNLAIVDKPWNKDRDIVTTPNFIINEILRKTVKEGVAGKSKSEILALKCADIACGSGAFLLELYQTLCDSMVDQLLITDRSQLIQTNISTYKLDFATKKEILTKCIYGVDKDFNAVEACKFGLLLKLLEGEDANTLAQHHPILPDLDDNIFFGNSLLSPNDVPDSETDEINPFDFGEMKFDYIVGNPPYMETEDMKTITPLEHELYPDIYTYAATGQYDKYFLFIERAFSLLKADGYLGYIVPNKFMKVAAAEGIRTLISYNGALKSITSFGAHQVFATKDKSTYTCLLILKKSNCQDFSYTEVNSLKGWIARKEEASETNIWQGKYISGKTWVLYTEQNRPLFEKLTKNSKPLVDILGEDYIFNGIQTSKNSVYVFKPLREDDDYFYIKACNKQEYQIEKGLTKPYYETDKKHEVKFETYKDFEPNAYVIFPYKKKRKKKGVTIIPLKEIEQKYPYLYSYLSDFKEILEKRSISPKPKTPNEWHRYGRSQNLTACEIKQKLIVGVMSQGDKYAVDNKGTIVSSGGTAGYCVVSIPSELNYSIYYIQAILGSLQGEWLASLYGEIFRGGFISRGTKVLMQIPVRTIDFSNEEEVTKHDDIVERQKKLISLGDKIAKASGNNRKRIPLQRKFSELKREQQIAINALYGMTEEEALKIPRIKEQYAAD